MTVYVLTDYPYPDNETIHGVVETRDQALACARKCLSDDDWYITAVKVGEFEFSGWATTEDLHRLDGQEKNVPNPT